MHYVNQLYVILGNYILRNYITLSPLSTTVEKKVCTEPSAACYLCSVCLSENSQPAACLTCALRSVKTDV